MYTKLNSSFLLIFICTGLYQASMLSTSEQVIFNDTTDINYTKHVTNQLNFSNKISAKFNKPRNLFVAITGSLPRQNHAYKNTPKTSPLLTTILTPKNRLQDLGDISRSLRNKEDNSHFNCNSLLKLVAYNNTISEKDPFNKEGIKLNIANAVKNDNVRASINSENKDIIFNLFSIHQQNKYDECFEPSGYDSDDSDNEINKLINNDISFQPIKNNPFSPFKNNMNAQTDAWKIIQKAQQANN
jgi:hypothetical protein